MPGVVISNRTTLVVTTRRNSKAQSMNRVFATYQNPPFGALETEFPGAWVEERNMRTSADTMLNEACRNAAGQAWVGEHVIGRSDLVNHTPRKATDSNIVGVFVFYGPGVMAL